MTPSLLLILPSTIALVRCITPPATPGRGTPGTRATNFRRTIRTLGSFWMNAPSVVQKHVASIMEDCNG